MGEKYEVITERILKGLNDFRGFFSEDYYWDFEEKILNMKMKIEASMQEGRLLKIGIVGEVKAGKSSFLNALIFDGNDVLPKASTPMTAALTKISYAENPSATIVFYSEKDWERVVSLSRKYDLEYDKYYQNYLDKYHRQNHPIAGIGNGMHMAPAKTKEEIRQVFNKTVPLQMVSCKELTEMYDRSSADLQSLLGRTIELQTNNMDAELHDYIGVNGQFTAIVKHVELRMNNDMLQEIEIVDTPGLNDPIISRGEATKRFLGECDVVFMLSYVGQFLTREDIMFMCETLPNEGIRNIILVGSKFDSGILDDNKSRDIKTACNSSKATYDVQARENIKKCLTSSYNVEVLKRIQDSLPPSYISSTLFSCAQKRKNGVPYSRQEENIIVQLKKHFKDFEDEYKSLLSLSGIINIRRDKILPVKKSKNRIIAEKNREILTDNKRILLKLLEDITIQAVQNKKDLEHYDKNGLEEKLCVLQTKLNSMRREIRNIFESSSVEAAKFLNNMKATIDLEIENYIDFDVQSHTYVKHGSCRTGFLGLFREHYTREVTTYTASVSDVISNMRGYISRCKIYANEEFEKIINIRELESRVKGSIIGAFDLSGEDFNENDILIPLEIVIKRIQIPQIDIEVEQFEHMIVDAFSGASVEGEAIHQLRLMENRVLGDIAKKIKEEFDKCCDRIDSIMTEQAATFVDNIIKQMASNIERLRNQIDDKENKICQYTKFCDALAEYKQMITGMEM